MPRPKKYPDAEKTIAAFFASVSDAFNHPTPSTSLNRSEEDNSVGARGNKEGKSIALLAEEFGISRLKVRKILITTHDLTYPETGRIQRLLSSGMKKREVCEQTGMAISTLNSFLPYEKGVYNLADVSTYAESSRLYRERKEQLRLLSDTIQYGSCEEQRVALWQCVCLFAGYPFVTSGRGSRDGVKFKYSVSTEAGAGGKHYEGEQIDGFGNELWVIRNGQRAEKSISRSSVDYALKVVVDARDRGE